MPAIAREAHPQRSWGSNRGDDAQLGALRLQQRPLLYVQLQEGSDAALPYQRLVEDVLQVWKGCSQGHLPPLKSSLNRPGCLCLLHSSSLHQSFGRK